MMNRRIWLLFFVLVMGLFLAACSGAATSEQEAETIVETVVIEKEGETIVETVIVEAPAEEAPAAEEPGDEITPLPTATFAPQPTQASQPTQAPTATALVEPRLVEVEWPLSLYLGDSDVVRMALIPTAKGYTLTTEFPDHTTTTQDVPIVRPEGYELQAVGRLDGVGFTISPAKDQVSSLPLDQPVTWHWSLTPERPGQQRLTVSLLLHWEPLPGTAGITREAVAYSKGLEVRVNSFFGLSRAQTLTTALMGLVLGGGLILFAVISGFPFRIGGNTGRQSVSRISQTALIQEPNRTLEIESPAGLHLELEEGNLLRSLFQRYQRLLIQQEFLSGYSGARTFLLIPIRVDGRSDAPTIAKLGRRTDIEQEYANYETFVKRTLPPVTARLQAPPVALKGGDCAALQYTFIGEPNTRPVSLRQALLENPDSKLLNRLFETFGPNWWMQRAPWTFRLAQEYDRLLPPHWVLEPDTGRGMPLDGRTSPGDAKLSRGNRVAPRNFKIKANNAPRDDVSLQGIPAPGQAALRLRWLSAEFSRGAVGRLVATRQDLLQAYTANFDLLGLPNPLEKLPARLNETITGTRSIIHGDLNLENVLIGPGGMIWLIDFATTREGHPLMDFAHLEAEIIAHVIAPQVTEGSEFLEVLGATAASLKPQAVQPSAGKGSVTKPNTLLSTLHEIAFNCLANPSQPREYWLALYLSCLGALKYRNLDDHQKYLLYLTAAHLAQSL